MARKEFTCGLDVALAVIGGKWKPLILFHLKNGPTRFAELRRLVAGVSEKVLIQHLRELVADKIVTPPRPSRGAPEGGLRDDAVRIDAGAGACSALRLGRRSSGACRRHHAHATQAAIPQGGVRL